MGDAKIIKTPKSVAKAITTASSSPQANLVKQSFDNLIMQKGNRVCIHYATQCPCKSKNSNQQSNCRNCGGTQWIYINPTESRMILHSMNMQTRYQAWSKENIGTVSISCLAEQEISYMDKITDLDSVGIYSEVCFLKNIDEESVSTSDSDSDSKSKSKSESSSDSDSDSDDGEQVYFFNTIYDIKEILYVAIFNGTQNPLVILQYGKDYHYKQNKIILNETTASTYVNKAKAWDTQDVSITIRYKYNKQYYVMDLPRETVETNTKFGFTDKGQTGVRLPIHAVGRALHYNLSEENFTGTRLNNNSFAFSKGMNPVKKKC